MSGYEDSGQKEYSLTRTIILACIVTFFVILIFVGSMLIIDRHVTKNMFNKVIDYVESNIKRIVDNQLYIKDNENDMLSQTSINEIVENVAVLKELNNSTFNNNILYFFYWFGTSILSVTSGIILYRSTGQRKKIDKDAKKIKYLLKESKKDKEAIAELHGYIKNYLDINSNLELCKSYIGLYKSIPNTDESVIIAANIMENIMMVGRTVKKINDNDNTSAPLSENQCAILLTEIPVIYRMLNDGVKKEMNGEIKNGLESSIDCLKDVEKTIKGWQTSAQTNF